MTLKEVEKFELLAGRLGGLSNEVQALAKKSPNDSLNQFKLGVVNGVLSRLNEVLGPGRLPIDGFSVFDSAAMPTTSDVLLVLSLYSEALEHIRAANITYYGGDWFWLADGSRSDVRTAAPKKLGG